MKEVKYLEYKFKWNGEVEKKVEKAMGILRQVGNTEDWEGIEGEG